MKVVLTINTDLIYKENIEYSSLLKQATELSKVDILRAIEKIKEAIKIESNDINAHKKLASYLRLAGQFNEAVDYLLFYSNNCSNLHKSATLDHLAGLYKLEKNIVEAIKLESYSVYYYTMYQGPIAFIDFDIYSNSICLNREYKKSEYAKLIDANMVNFWGIDWLRSYYKNYLEIYNSIHYNVDETLMKMQKQLNEKSFEKYKLYISNFPVT